MTANNQYRNNTIRLTITDSHNNTATLDWTGRTRWHDDTPPTITPTSGSTNEENFFHTNTSECSSYSIFYGK